MNDMIYNQHHIPQEQWRYGFRPSAATGCGWIATYNALRLMGWGVDPEQLITWYEGLLPLIHGNFGTTLPAPALRFHLWGFPVKVVVNREKFDEAAQNADACILFYRWRRGYRLGAHFAAFHHKAEGFVGYNTFRNSTGPDRWGASIPAFLKAHRWFGAVLICIQNKKGKENANDIA